MADTVQIAGLAEFDHEQEATVIETSDCVEVSIDSACVSATCQEAIRLGIPDRLAKEIAPDGIAAFKNDVPVDKAVQFKCSSQLRALSILGKGSHDVALLFTMPSQVSALNVLGKDGADIAQKVSSQVQVEAIKAMQDLGISPVHALRVRTEEDLAELKRLEKDSIPARAVNASVPVSRAREFVIQSQVDAASLVRGADTALRFVNSSQVQALKRNSSIPVSQALRANEVIISAIDNGMPCAWEVTNSHQIVAFKVLKANGEEVETACADSLGFNSSHQVDVLNKTGDVSSSLPFYNPYAQQALHAGIDVHTAKFVGNKYALDAVTHYSVTGALASNFTQRCQVEALEEKLMTAEEAAGAGWVWVRFIRVRNGCANVWTYVSRGVDGVIEYAETNFPYYKRTAFLGFGIGVVVLGWQIAPVFVYFTYNVAKTSLHKTASGVAASGRYLGKKVTGVVGAVKGGWNAGWSWMTQRREIEKVLKAASEKEAAEKGFIEAQNKMAETAAAYARASGVAPEVLVHGAEVSSSPEAAAGVIGSVPSPVSSAATTPPPSPTPLQASTNGLTGQALTLRPPSIAELGSPSLIIGGAGSGQASAMGGSSSSLALPTVAGLAAANAFAAMHTHSQPASPQSAAGSLGVPQSSSSVSSDFYSFSGNQGLSAPSHLPPRSHPANASSPTHAYSAPQLSSHLTSAAVQPATALPFDSSAGLSSSLHVPPLGGPSSWLEARSQRGSQSPLAQPLDLSLLAPPSPSAQAGHGQNPTPASWHRLPRPATPIQGTPVYLPLAASSSSQGQSPYPTAASPSHTGAAAYSHSPSASSVAMAQHPMPYSASAASAVTQYTASLNAVSPLASVPILPHTTASHPASSVPSGPNAAVYLTSAPMLSASATHTPVGSLGHAAATYSDSSATSPAVDSSMQAEQAPLSPPYTPAHAPLPAVTSPTSHAGIPVSSATSPHAQSSANLGQIRRLGARANSPRSTAAISGRVPANTSASSLPRSGSFSASQTSATLSVPPLLLEADVHSASQLPLSPSTSASTPASDASSDKGNKKPKSPQGSESKKDPDAKRPDGDRDGHEQGDREGDESGKGSDEGVGDSAL